MPTIVVTYFNHSTKHSETREREVRDTTQATLQGVIDVFDANIGTVLAIDDKDTGTRLHKAMIEASDLK